MFPSPGLERLHIRALETINVTTLTNPPKFFFPSTRSFFLPLIRTVRNQRQQQERADIHNVDMGSSTALMVINLYGWQGAANNTNSRKMTVELIEAAQQEFDTAEMGPKVILGDSKHGYQQQPGHEKTHHTHNGDGLMWLVFQHQSTTSNASPRAQRIANDLAVIAITSCCFDTQASCDVHSPIVIQMCPRDFSPTVFVARKPSSFDWQRIKQTCIQRMDEEQQSCSSIDGATKHGSITNEEIKIYEQHRLEISFRKHFSKVESQLEEALARSDPNVRNSMLRHSLVR